MRHILHLSSLRLRIIRDSIRAPCRLASRLLEQFRGRHDDIFYRLVTASLIGLRTEKGPSRLASVEESREPIIPGGETVSSLLSGSLLLSRRVLPSRKSVAARPMKNPPNISAFVMLRVTSSISCNPSIVRSTLSDLFLTIISSIKCSTLSGQGSSERIVMQAFVVA